MRAAAASEDVLCGCRCIQTREADQVASSVETLSAFSTSALAPFYYWALGANGVK